MLPARAALTLSLLGGILAGAGALVLRAADEAPLLDNGDFQTDADGDQWPDGWSRAKAGASWEMEEGRRFLRLQAEEPGQTVMLSRAVPIPEGVEAVELAFRGRCMDLVPGKQPWFDARVLMEFRDAEGKKVPPTPKAPYFRKNTDGWVEKRVRFLVPEGAVSLAVMPALFQVQSGTFDLADVTLTAVDAGSVREAAGAAAAAHRQKLEAEAAGRRAKAAAVAEAGGSLIGNGGFERDADGDQWPDDWGRPKEGGSWGEEAGGRFLRLQSPGSDKTVLLYRPVDLPEGVRALELSWRWRVNELRPGKQPWFDARIMMEFKDAAGQKLGARPSPPYRRSDTKGWLEQSVKFMVPEGALTLELMPALLQVEGGTLDLDDLSLREADPAVVQAEMEERARKNWRPEDPAPEEPQPQNWPKEIKVAGNRLRDADGREVWLQGVHVVSLEWNPRGESVLASMKVAIEDWKANVVRLSIKDEFWYGRGSGQTDGGAAYRELVDAAVRLAANRGAYVVLDHHRYRAVKEAHVPFWKDVAAAYKDHPAVLFDILNEPHTISWEVWRNGGFVEERKTKADEDAFLPENEKARSKEGFPSPGMQALVDAIRSTGARNIIIAGGLDWAYDLSGVLKGYALDDKTGNGIMYSTHIYNWKKDWQGKVLDVAAVHPVFVGEVGADVKKMEFMPAEIQEEPSTWVPDMLGMIQKHRLHWTGFSFHPRATPVMISDWHYTPTSYWGEPAKQALSGRPFEMRKMR